MSITDGIESMGVDALIALRDGCRANKLWAASDLMRDELDRRGAYVFDEKGGGHIVWHVRDRWFAQMNKEGTPQFATRRAYVEHRMRQDRNAVAFFDSWLDRVGGLSPNRS